MLKKEIILALQALNGFGLSTIKSLSDFATTLNLEDDFDANKLLDFLSFAKAKKALKRVKVEDLSLSILQNALDLAKLQIEKASKLGIKIISINDNCYPHLLKDLLNDKQKNVAPILLYAKGNTDLLNQKSVAIIGSRTPTIEGEKAATYFSKEFASNGFNIVSGLALGCDALAHQSALKANGATTAILAHGLDVSIYPKENKDLAKSIVENNGLLISEYGFGTPCTSYQLVERDRLQSGMSTATVLIQSKINGGSMHAVNFALYNQRLLYAVNYKANLVDVSVIQGNIHLLEGKNALPLGANNLQDVISTIDSNL
ncbi:MAG: DNA-protecting protein DprA [Succinivibrio sp.]|nr:DNA-protecting protein DprA [Succinivibrio sp.]MDD6068282.1 DNA-protecting protein DprA [Succinivibrio sp.]MDD7287611.1 DNA-protecting protein DprA [Succinivibrio sp.]